MDSKHTENEYPSKVPKVPEDLVTKKDVKIIATLAQSCSDFMVSFLEENGVCHLVKIFESTEHQRQLMGLIKFHTTESPQKDPNEPKKPMTPYKAYCKVRRHRVKEKFPGLSFVEQTKYMSKRWKILSEERKMKYIALSNQDRERYATEMGKYVPAIGTDLQPKRKRGRPSTKKKRKGPKRARTSYILFCMEKRDDVKESNPEMTGKQITTELARMWKEDYPTKSDREKWTSQAVEDKIRYDREVAELADSADSAELVESKTIMSGKLVFARERREYLLKKYPEMSTAELTRRINKRWAKQS